MSEPQQTLKKLEQVRSQTLRRLEDISQEQLDWRPPASGGEEKWSLGEVFMHIAIDEFYVRELISRPLLAGIQPPEGVHFIPPPPPKGTSMEVISYWLERARDLTRIFFRDWPEDANYELTHVGGLEAMNGLEWMEGYASHEAFHHGQIDSLIEQVNEKS